MASSRMVAAGLFTTLLMLAPGSQAASWLIPGAVNGTEAGTHWATEVRIQNRDAAPARVEFAFQAEGAATAGEAIAVTIEPGQTASWRNALRDLLGLEDARGVLLVSSDAVAVVTAFRHTDEREAVLGQALPALAGDQWLAPGVSGDLLWLAESADYRSGIWLAFASPDSTAEVVLLDESGGEIARRTVEGAGGSRWLPLSELGVSDRPLLRGRVRFLAGSGVAASETLHVPTGDRMGAPAQVADILQTDLSLNPALRGSSFRTDLRAYNPTARQMALRFGWNGKFLSRTLEPGQMVEVEDIAAALGLEGDQQGVLRISSLTAGLKPVAMGRVLRLTDGGAAGPGELMTPEVTVEFGGAPNPWRLTGVPEAADSLFLGLRGGFTASEAEVNIYDAAGTRTFATAAPLAVPALGARLDDLLALSGGPMPAAGSVEVSARSGQMAPALLGLLRGSGDIAPVGPSRPAGATFCVTPLIMDFSANPGTLASAGQVTLAWRTAQAAGIRLSSDGALREANGSAAVAVSESSTLRLTAFNACGEASAELQIAIGPPQITAARTPGSAEPAAGRPGQLAEFAIGNLSDPRRVVALHFRAGNGAQSEAAVEGVDARGSVHVLVPYIWTEGAGRYWRGEATVSVEMDDGSVSGAFPFRILPLQAVSDPVAQFRAMLASLGQMAAAVETETRRQGFAALAATQRSSAAPHAAALEKLANDIAAAGSGTLAYSTTATGDNAIVATLTRDDLADLMAYELNLRESLALLRNTGQEAVVNKAASERDAGGERAAGTCIAAKEPFIPFCKALDIRKQLEAAVAARANEFLKQFTSDIPPNLEKQGEKAIRDWIKKKLAKTTLYALLNRLKSYTTYLNLVCLVRPIELDGFQLTTQPPRRATSSTKEVMYSQYDNQPTLIQVNAYLVPHFKSNQIRDKLIDKEAKYVAAQLAKLKVPQAVGEWLIRTLIQSGQDEVELKAIEEVAKALNFKSDQLYQVGKCDLLSFFPAPGLKAASRSAVRIATGFVQGEDNFYYLGRKINATATMCIEPVARNFIFSDNVESRDPKVNDSACPFSDQVITRGARTAGDTSAAFPLPQFSDNVNVGPGEGVLRAGAWTGASNNFTSARPAGYNPTLTEVTATSPWVQEQRFGSALARVVLRAAGKNRWEIEASADGEFILITETDVVSYTSNVVLDTSLAIPETHSGTYTLKMESSAEAVTGVCGLNLSLKSAPKTVGGNNSIGGSVSPDSPRSLRYSLEAKDQPGPAGISIGLFAYASALNKPHKVACRAKGTIELMLPEQ